MPPVFDYQDKEVVWTLEWFEEFCDNNKDPYEPDAPGTIPDGEAAAWIWQPEGVPLADLGHAQALTGSLWRCCPRYYAEFVEGEVAVVADAIIDAATWVSQSATLTEAFDGQPTFAAKDTLRMVLEARDRIDTQRQARRDQAAREEARKNGFRSM